MDFRPGRCSIKRHAVVGVFPLVLVFPNCKPPLLCVAPGFCAWAITNKACIGHQSLLVTSIIAMNKKWVSSFRLLVSNFTHTHAQHQQRPPAFSNDQQLPEP